METKKPTGYFDKNGREIRLGDLVLYSEAPLRYADAMCLVIEKGGVFCQAHVVYNATHSEKNGRYQYRDIDIAVKSSTPMRFNETTENSSRLSDTEVLDLGLVNIDLNDSKYLIDYMNEKHPLP